MSCNSCQSSKNGTPRGCQNNGTCGTDGCNKLTVFDWLANMAEPSGLEDFRGVEVRFKNSRKEFYHNANKLNLQVGDLVVTEAQSGYDLGMVTLTKSLVKVQMKRKNQRTDLEKYSKILRIATQEDIDQWTAAREKEESIKKRAREMAIALNMEMKISDVEFQGDGSKVTFYYTAESRVDFRQLIKDMAMAFHTRIEMRQIGLRQEASRLGGVGSCGRELCCSTWLTDFRAVNMAAARYQQLALNPQKLAGQCGKLKCCLNFELDSYLDALKDFPKTDTKIRTEKGIAVCQKTDIFKGMMWFAYKNDWAKWYPLTVDQVKEILAKNKENIPVDGLEDYAQDLSPTTKDVSFENVVGQDSLTRFDKPKKNRPGRNRKNKRRSSSNRKGNTSNNSNKNS